MSADDSRRVVVVGDGVAGLSASIFTARHGLETAVLGEGGSLLRRNAIIENYPGFPAGVDSRRLLGMLRDQARRSGALLEEATVERVERADGGDGDGAEGDGGDGAEGDGGDGAEGDGGSDGFAVTTADGETWSADYVVAATKNETGYLAGLDGVEILDRGKTYVATDGRGRTGVDGLYAAGRLAQKPHQAIVCAGHGAEVAVTLLEDDERGFYHDWVAPAGYFTGRDRDVPPGCEEVDDAERRRRARQARQRTGDYFEEPHPEDPEQHPSVREGE